MNQLTVGIREFKARLGTYLDKVKAGSTLVITDRGKPIARLIPIQTSPEVRIRELVQAGFAQWSGRSLPAHKPTIRSRGKRSVADLLLENRE